MRFFPHALASRRRERALRRCSLCGAALYLGDAYWYINGCTACEDCFPVFARRELAAFHCICEEGDEVP